MASKPVAIIMGSQSDWATMKHAAKMLDALKVGHVARIVSAHRTPKRLYEFAGSARKNGFKVIIAGAGGAAHLPGMTASLTPLPVLGVPIKTHALEGKDSLLSIMQMPGGIPVGTLAIGKAGAINAALLAASVLALSDGKLAKRLDAWRKRQTRAVAKRAERREPLLKPGATIGILGGGQLARMLALAAAPLGLRCHVYSPEKDSCAFDVVHAGTCAKYDDEAALGRFAGARRRHHLRIRERAGQDRRLSRPAPAGVAGPAGAGDDAGPACRKEFHQRAEDRDRALWAGPQRNPIVRG